MLHLITYISDYTGPATAASQTAADIVAVAKAQNPLHAITGVLFFTRGKFLQVIEGPEEALRQLMRNIESDTRHTNVEYVIDTPVQRRGFPQWNMDFFNLDESAPFDAARLRQLTAEFENVLLPRADLLVMYYKKVLEYQQRSA